MKNYPLYFKRWASLLIVKNAKILFAITFILFLSCDIAQAQIAGRVYKDFNANGTWDSTEVYLDQGRAGVRVEAFDNKGISKGYAITDLLGKYLISGVSGNLRVHFSLPSYYTDGFITKVNSGSQSSIQLVKAPVNNVDLGINFADDFCGEDPSVVVPCYVVGIGNSLTPNDGLALFKYSASGTDHSQIQMPNASLSVIGSTWGGAYQKETGSFFMASFMKRHANFGIGGTGAIYVTTDVATPSKSATSLYLKLTDFGINTGDDVHSYPDYQADTINPRGNPFDEVGKMSLGDLDISSDGKYLFVVNLKQRKLHQIFIDNPHKPAGTITAADIKSWDIPSGFDEINKGIGRPFGLCVRQEKVYVGVVCDASISQDSLDLKARIYEMKPEDSVPLWKLDIEFPLNYKKGIATGERPESGKWYPWISDWYVPGQPDFLRGLPDPSVAKYASYPMPLLSDMEIDSEGSMIMAFTDRFSHQVRFAGVDAHGKHHGTFGFDPRLGGDILRASSCDGVSWTMENNATLCGISSVGKNNNEGIGGGEFYSGDSNPPLGHLETSVGSLAFRPGSREILLAVTDPINTYSAGVTWLSNENGGKKRAFEIISELNNIIIQAPVNYGKASSLGDINMVCDVSPLEIGNFLWRDNNGNGIQDAGEKGIPNIILNLVNSNNKIVGIDTTDINGVYSFNHFNVIDTLGILKPNRLGPQPKTTYFVKVKGKIGTVPTFSPTAKKTVPITAFDDLHSGTPLAPLHKTTAPQITNNGGALIEDAILANPNAGSGVFQDLVDSDGIITGTDGTITVNTGEIGQSNHSFDFAYCPLPTVDLTTVKATCNPITDKIQDNAKIVLNNLGNAQKVAYSVGSIYTGPLYSNATDLNFKTTFTIDSLPGLSTSKLYTVRIFNGSDACSRDFQVMVDSTVCVPCSITAKTIENSVIVYNNETLTNPNDDYFTVLVLANAVSSGIADLYEVVINAKADGSGGTILNLGGTTYGSPIRVGNGKELKANGQPIKLTFRDKNKPACIQNITVQANALQYECKTVICLPLTAKKK